MNNSYKYFENQECKYYPCHKNIENINCLFCYCPMYFLDNCLGNPSYIEKEDGVKIKNCQGCTFPHNPDNYEAILKKLSVEIKSPTKYL